MRSELEDFTLKQRVFLVKNYYQYTGDYLCVKTKYEDSYKDVNGVPAFSYDILIEIINLFERSGSVMKAAEGATGGGEQHIEQVYVRDFIKMEDPIICTTAPSTSIDCSKGNIGEDCTMLDLQDSSSDDSDKEEDAKNHACDLCGMIFNSFEKWNNHKLKKHKEIPAVPQSTNKKHKKSLAQQFGLKKRRVATDTKESDHDISKCNLTDDKLTTLSDTVKLDPSYDKIFNEMACKLDRLINMQKNVMNNIPDLADSSDKQQEHVSELLLRLPIATKEKLQEFNEDLKDEEYRLKAIDALFKIRGQRYKASGNSKKCAYKLIDVLFSRQLLVNYSWTGLSHCKTKDAFNQFTFVFDVFYNVVRMTNESYAREDAERFFKAILRLGIIRLNRLKSNQSCI